MFGWRRESHKIAEEKYHAACALAKDLGLSFEKDMSVRNTRERLYTLDFDGDGVMSVYIRQNKSDFTVVYRFLTFVEEVGGTYSCTALVSSSLSRMDLTKALREAIRIQVEEPSKLRRVLV